MFTSWHEPELESSLPAIETRLTVDPVGLGKPLRYSFVGHRRIRVGDYRIVYRIDLQNNVVVVILIKHRKDVYSDSKSNAPILAFVEDPKNLSYTLFFR